MSSRHTSRNKKRPHAASSIPVVVVESHQHVLEHVHATLRKQKLMTKPWSMLHLDAHPDLACPATVPAVACFAPRQVVVDDKNLYERLDATTSGTSLLNSPIALR